MSLLLSLLLLVALKPALHGTVDVMEGEGAATEPPPIIPLPLDKCKPDCTGSTPDKPLVPDPMDCHKFYICFGGEPDGPSDCPDGEYFNTTTKDCQPNGAEECQAICSGGGGDGMCLYSCTVTTATTAATTAATTETTTAAAPGPPGPSVFETGDTRFIADPYDCSYYYRCDDETTAIICPEPTPFFNGETCQKDESKCCHCTPFCYEGDVNTKIIDPLDCTKYYYCLKDNEVPQYSGTCPSGENFDQHRQKCSMTVPCFTMCTNVVNDKGCIDVFTCQEVGYFSACPNLCGPKYYHCSADDIGNIIGASTCTDGNVFYQDNTQCVPPTDCPYPQPGF